MRVRPDFLQPILSVLVFRGCLTAATVPTFQVQCIGEEDRLDLFLQGSNLGFAHGRLTRLHGPGLHSWPEGDGYPGEEPMLLRRNVTQLGRLWETAGCGRFHATFAQLSPFGLHSPRPMAFQPMSLSRRPLPFDHPEWILRAEVRRVPLTRCHPERAHKANPPQRESLQLLRGPYQKAGLVRCSSLIAVSWAAAPAASTN